MKNLSKSTNYLKIGQAAKALGVSIDTLRRWEKAGKIQTQRTPGGTRLYSLSQLKKVNPAAVEDFQTKGLTTEELLKKVQKDSKGSREPDNQSIRESDISETPIYRYSEFSGKQSFVNKFLIGTAVLSAVTLLITSWIAASYLTQPKATQEFFKNNVASGLLSPFHKLAEESVAVISPQKAQELGFVPKEEQPPPIPISNIQYPISDNVLAVTSTVPFLEVNADTQINGALFVRDQINNLSLEGTPSASTITIATGGTTLTISDSSTIDQDLAKTASPAFNTLNLSATKDQLVFQSGGPSGTLTWIPTAARVITLPDATTTLVGIDNKQTLTNKTLSGADNTFKSIPNSALSNNKVTITAGTNLSGGGDVELGSSVTLSLASSPAISGVIKLADGTAAAPALTFTDDTDTGLYRIGSNKIGLITAGSATSGITIDGSGNLGIGNITPSATLYVSGNAGIGYTGSSSAVPGLGLAVNGNVGIGTTTANSKLVVVGNASIGSTYSGLAAPTNGLFVDGNVGIGATTSSNKLDVWGNSRLAGTLTVDSNSTIGGTLGVTGVTTLSANNAALSFTGTTPSLTSGSNVFGIFAGGNVGIGTTATLGSSFNVNGNQIIGSTFIGGAAPANGLAVSGNIGIGTTTANSNLSVAGSAHIGALYQGTAAPTNGLFVDGNVGIGATTSSNLLDVWGNARITGTLTVDGSTTSQGVYLAPDGSASAPTYSFSSDSDTGLWRIGSNQIALTTGGGSHSGLSINSSGNIGIGNTSASQLFQINATGSSPFVVTSAGNVGIANSAPSFALDIIGSTRISNNTTLGDTSSDLVTFNAVVNSNILADANNTRDIGSSSVRWANGYFTTLDATNLSGTVTGGSTTSSSWTINSDNSTNNAEISSLAFETGTGAGANFNAVMQWNASGDAGRYTGYDNNFVYNYPISILSQVSGGNQTFTSGSLFNYGQNSSHAITQGGAFVGVDIDFSSNITNSTQNQTGVLITLKDGSSSGTSKGFELAGTADFGIYTQGETQNYFSGNVGLGTTAPRQKLQVNADGTSAFVVTSGGNVGIGFTTPTASLQISSTASQDLFRVDDNGAGDTSPFVINLDGNVGIANSAPSYTLDIVGTTRISGVTTLSANNGALSFTGTTPSLTSGSSVFGIFAGGNVGIGTTGNVYGGLTVRGAGTGTNITLQTYGSGLGQGLSVLDNGNVGIGTTSPGISLEVVGGGRVQVASTTASGQTVNAAPTATTITMPASSASGYTGTVQHVTLPGITYANTSNTGTATLTGLRLSQGNIDTGNQTGTSPMTVTALDISGANNTNRSGLYTWKGVKLTTPSLQDQSSQSPKENDVRALDVTLGTVDGTSAALQTGLYITGGTQTNGTQRGIYVSMAAAAHQALYVNQGISYFGGNVGIGTTVPNATLSIQGNVGIGYTGANQAIPSNGLAVSGNVGIGTTSPSTALQVIGTATVTTLNATSAIQLNGTSINTGGTLSNVAYLDSANVFSANQNFNLGFDVDDAFVVADGGALTTSQTVTLSGTNNALRFTGTTPSISTSNGSFSLFPSTGNVGIGTSSVGGSLIVASGNVGIGFTSPTANLHVLNTATQNSFRVDDVANDTSPFVINLDGNVGIANSAPSYALDVIGTGRFSGAVTLGSTLSVTGDTTLTGDLAVNGGDLTTTATTFNLINATATTVNFAGAATTLSIGASTGTTTVNNALTITGTLTANGTLNANGAFTLGDNGDTGSINTSDWDIDTLGNMSGIGTITTDGLLTLSVNNAAISFTGTTPSITSGSSLFGIFAGGNVGIGTTGNVYGGLTVRGAGTGTNITLQTYGSGLGQGLTVLDNGNVGIGTTSPTSNLHVVGTANITSTATIGSTLSISDGTAGTPGLNFTSDTNTGLWRIGTDQIALTTGGGAMNGLAINSSGNVGIGTTGPAAKLDVRSSLTGNNTPSSAGSVEIINDAGSVTADNGVILRFRSRSRTAGGIEYNSIAAIKQGKTNATNDDLATYMSFWTTDNTTRAPEERIRIDAEGNIGIGTSSPLSLLSVAGSAHIGSLYQGTAAPTNGLFVDGNVGIGATTSSNLLDVWGNARITGTLTVDSTGTLGSGLIGYSGITAPASGLAISGNVGIGFTSPTANLHIVNTATQNSFRVDDVANDTSPFVINLDGNVGVGNSAPSYTLDVVGTGRFSSTLTVGSTLTTNLTTAGPVITSSAGVLSSEAQLALSRGGTNANLTASNGGIVYSTATALGILAGTSTANQVLLSGSSTTPAWSTATYPATTTINQLLYSSSTNAVAGLATANSSILVTDSSGVPSLSTTLPAHTVSGVLTLSANNGALSFTGTTPSLTSGSSVFGIFAGGNVGIGTTGSLYGGLTVRGAGTGTGITFQTYGSGLGQGLTVLDNGNVGIGTTNPSGALTIDADGTETVLVRKDADPTDGDVLTIDTTNKVVRIGESFTNSSTGTTLTAYGDTTVKGKMDIESISNITDIFVYDTTKDSDGGKWTNDERVKASSWYNETIDATGAGCTIDTNDRCGRKEFPEKTIIIATTTKLYIFDAKDNTLWMDFRKGATTTEQMIGPTSNSTGSAVYALNGKVYYGNNGTTGQLYAIDFKADRAYRYNATDDYIGIQTIASRNTTVTWLTGPSSPIVNAVINDVHAKVVNGDSFVVIGTDAGMSVINETDNTVYDYDDEATAADEDYNAVWLDGEGNLWALNETAQQLEKWNLVVNDTADENPGNPNSSWDELSTPALFATAQTINVAPGALYVTDGTSVVDGKSQTVYVGHNGGLTVVNTKVGDETNGSVKYYSNSYITEEMPGDIRAMYPLSESSGGNGAVLDRSVKAGKLTNVGGVTFSASAARGTGVTLNGSTGYLCTETGTADGTCDDDANFDFGSTGDFSISMWAKNTAGTAGRHLFFAKQQTWNGATTGYSANLASGADAGRVDFRIREGSNVLTVTTNPADAITDSNWHHYTFVRKTNGTVLEIWIDGALKITTTGTARNSDNALSFRIGTDSDVSVPWGGSIDEVMVTAEALSASQIKQMYLIGNRALQNHTASRITGVTGADNYQRLMGSASGGTSTTNRVFAVTTDDSNQFIYAGLNDGTNNTGGVTVIGVDSDSAVDLYDATANTGKDDDAGTQFASSDVVAVSLSGTPCIGYNSGTTACANTATIGIAGTNDTTTSSWMERNDASLYSTLATLTSPDQVKNNITVNNIFRVFNTYNNLTASTGEMIETPAFQVNQLGQLTANASSILTADAFTFTNEGSGLSFRVNDVASDTSPFVIDAGGNVGVGFTSPTANMHIVNTAAQDSLRIDDVANDTSPFVVNLDGNVGIANSAPSYTLDVIGTTRFSSTVTSSGVFLGPDGTATAPAYSFSGDTNTGLWRIGADQIALTTGGAAMNGLAINSSGNVGVGTTGPTSQLHIVETATSVPTLHIRNVSTQNYNEMIRLDMQDSFASGDQGGISFRQGTLELGRIASVYKPDGVDRWGLLFRTYDNAVMKDTFYIQGNGNVGIGTTNPTALTHLVQTAAGNAFRIDDVASDTTPFIIDQSGNVGIGLTGSAARLSIQSADGSYSDLLLTENDATLGNKGAAFLAAASGTAGGVLIIQTHNNSSALTNRLQINESGYTGVATLAGASATDLCSDTTTMSGYNTLASCSSSIRYKENVAPLVVDKSKVFSLQPVSFKWKNRDEWDVGLIAEDTAQIIPELATYKDGQIEGVKYKLLSIYLLDILKEHDQRLSQFADLRVDSDGTLIIPKAKIDTLRLQNFGLGNLQVSSSSLTTSSESEYFNVAEKIASQSTQIANLDLQVATTSAHIASQSAELASASAQLASIKSEVESLKLTPPDILLASGSATLASLTVSEATVSAMLTAYSAQIQDNFKVLGETILAKTNVVGDLTVDGTLSIENGSALNVIGTLFLQKSLLAQKVDIFNGKVTIDSSGNIKTQGQVLASEVKANKLTISNTPIASSSATLAASIGTGTLSANTTSTTIPSADVNESSKVFITPTTPTDKVLSVTNIKNGESFDISVTSPSSTDIKFNWWIVQTE